MAKNVSNAAHEEARKIHENKICLRLQEKKDNDEDTSTIKSVDS